MLKETLKMKRQIWLAAMVAILWVTQALAQPVVDGTADVSYGAALSVQDTRTHFGDGPVGGNPDPILTGGGSEIDQVFATVSNGRLYVTVTGNLEENFNKLDVFIDSSAGGENQLNGANLPGGLDSFCCNGFPPPNGNNTNNVGALQRMNGLKFDAGFNPDYMLIFTHGRESVGPRGDYNNDLAINAADYTKWRNNLGSTIAQATAPANPGGPMSNVPENPNVANTTELVGQDQYDTWKSNFGSKGRSEFWALSAHYADLTQGTNGTVGSLGMQLAPRGEPRVLRPAEANALGDYAFYPTGNPGNTDSLVSSYTLDGLGQGELIDRDYALGPGGCDDDGGDGCLAREFEFALDVDPSEVGDAFPNDSNHRRFNNIVDLQMALNNSNVVGVRGSGGPFELVPGEDDPENVLTGIEFSIPLSQIGNPTGDIRIMAIVNGGNHDFLSNQVSGDGVVGEDPLNPPDTTGPNIGSAFFGASPGGSFLNIAGDQFVTVVQALEGGGSVAGVPEPASAIMAIAGLVVGGLMIRRRG
jgi:hypothetical protein